MNDRYTLRLFGVSSVVIFSMTMIVYLVFRLSYVASSGAIVPISVLSSLVIIYLAFRRGRGNTELALFLKATGIYILASVVIVLLISLVYDTSYDGRTYHQEIIISMVNGYNPVYGHIVGTETDFSIFINHYAKGFESVCAAMYSFTGSIETGKAFHALMMLSNFALCLELLLKWNKLSRLMNIAVSLVVAFNIICVVQLTSTYVDGIIGSLITYLLLVLILYEIEDDAIYKIAIAAGIIALVNVKFTSLVYVSLILFAYAIYKICHAPRRDVVKTGLFVAAIYCFSVLGIGFNPYVTNFVNNGHPFYPLYGTNSINVITEQHSKDYDGMNRFEKLIKSTFSHSYNSMTKSSGYKIPFTVGKSEFKRAADVDAREGGFGPFFGGILLISIYVYIKDKISRFKNIGIRLTYQDKSVLLLDFLILLDVTSIIINHECWWARLVPQMWMLPILMILSVYYRDTRKSKVFHFVIIIYLITIAIILPSSLIKHIRETIVMKDQLNILKNSKETFEVVFETFKSDEIKLRHAGLNYVILNDISQFHGRYTNVLLGNHEISHNDETIFKALNATKKKCLHYNIYKFKTTPSND